MTYPELHRRRRRHGPTGNETERFEAADTTDRFMILSHFNPTEILKIFRTTQFNVCFSVSYVVAL